MHLHCESRSYPSVCARLGLAILLAAALYCGAPGGGANSGVVRPALQYAERREMIDAGRLLGAQPLEDDSALARLASAAWYQNYQRTVRAAWQRYEREHLTPMREWRGALAAADSPDVFYPFSGPDISHALTLFPDAEHYVLIGLEPTGRIPAPEDDAPAQIAGGLSQLLSAVQDTLGRNYFKTVDMAEEIGGTEYSGVAGAILFFLGAYNAEVLDAHYLYIEADGSVRAESQLQAGPSHQGVRYVFRLNGKVRTVSYFSLNLADIELARQPNVKRWLASLPPGSTMLKAASFLMYRASFDDIRSVILSRSRRIVMDSSGMPFFYVNRPEQWRVTLYGGYVRPVAMFLERFEPELYFAYRSRETSPLPFSYGYNIERGQSHVIVAERQAEYAIGEPQFDGSREIGEASEWQAGVRFVRTRTYNPAQSFDFSSRLER